jgi:hypothetical protein
MVLLSSMPKQWRSYGTMRRPDGEEFALEGTLYETPPEYEYWLGHPVARHKTWGNLTFQLIIPKKTAPTFDLALLLMGGDPLEQVKAEVLHATSSSRDLRLTPSSDGWILI